MPIGGALDRAFLRALRSYALEHDSYLKISIKVPHRPTIKRGSNNDAGTIIRRYRWSYLKRRSHTNFNSYVVGTERETKDLHLELSIRIRSRARHTVKSPKKERDDGLQAN